MSTTTTFMSGGRRGPIEMFDPAAPSQGGAIVIVHGSDGLADSKHVDVLPRAFMREGRFDRLI
jgi:hypothetical protein